MKRVVRFFLLFSFFALYFNLFAQKVDIRAFSSQNINLKIKGIVNEEMVGLLKYGIKFTQRVKVKFYRKRFLLLKRTLKEFFFKRSFYYDFIKDVYVVEEGKRIDTYQTLEDFKKGAFLYNISVKDICIYPQVFANVKVEILSEVGRKYEFEEILDVKCREEKKKR